MSRRSVADRKSFAIRLEVVRRELGIESVKEFLKEVRDRAGLEISYEAARRYHLDRASVKYLAAVSKAFDVSLDYLFLGEEPVFRER